MMSELDTAIVLLSSTDDKNKAFGTAFIIAQDDTYSYLLTCAHVLEQINGLNSTDNKLKILGIDQPVEVEKCGASDAIDIALLKVQGLPKQSIFTLFNKGATGDTIKITGYSIFDSQTHSKRPLDGTLGASIMLASSTANAQFPAWDVYINTEQGMEILESGYSGSPLYNQNGAVIGVVSHRRSGDKGHAFCISNLRTLYPEITNLVPAFKQLDGQSRVTTIRTGLLQRMTKIMPVYKAIAVQINQLSDKELDDDDEVILSVCEGFINDEVPAADFIDFCKSLNTTPATTTGSPNYNLLAQRLNKGEIVICIGSELAPCLDPQLQSANQLPQAISALAEFENINPHALAEVCEYAEIHKDCTRSLVITALQTLLTPPENHTPNIALFDILVNVQNPFLVISCGFDTFLEQRLRNSAKRFVSIVVNTKSTKTESEKRLFLSFSDKEDHTCSDQELSTLRLMEEGYSIIYHPRGIGVSDDHLADSLLLSERDYFKAIDVHYPSYLHNRIKRRGLWFLGFSPDSWETRLLATAVQDQRVDNNSGGNQTLVIQQQATKFAEYFWADLNCKHYPDISLGEFSQKIGASL